MDTAGHSASTAMSRGPWLFHRRAAPPVRSDGAANKRAGCASAQGAVAGSCRRQPCGHGPWLSP
eukprot:11371849-Alexandrium_andersonii.AAC.1